MARRLAQGLGAVLIGAALALLIAEAGLRVYARVTPNVDVEFARYARLMKAAAPGQDFGFLHEPDSSHRFFGVDVTINSRGFRDRELPGDFPREGAVVALLGDSVTFGWGVPYGERFSEILEREWSGNGSPVELINTGHGNWNTAQEHAALVELLGADPLDGVLQVWYINDAEPTPEHRPAPWYAHLHLPVFLWSKTDLLERRAGAKGTYVEYYRSLYREDAPGYRAFRNALQGIGEETSRRGIPWVFVLLPEMHDIPGPFHDVYETVASAARASGAVVVDVTGDLAAEDPETLWLARNDVHPNALGHAAIARAVASRLDGAIFRSGRT